MKKQLIISLLSIVSLTGCNQTRAEVPLKLNVVTPSGAPAIAFYKHLAENKLEINSNPVNVTAYFTNLGAKDVIVAPTNAGINAITNSLNPAPFKIAATLTFGNFYIASLGNDSDNEMNEGDYVVLFQQNNIPDKLFQAVYGTNFDIHYVNAASDAAKCIITGKNETDNNATVNYVLIAEPALTTALAKNSNASLYSDLQNEYKNKFQGLEITQASVFIANSVSKEQADAFLNELRLDVRDLLKKPSILKNYVSDFSDTELIEKFSSNESDTEEVLTNGNRINLNFKDAFTNKSSIDQFIATLGMEATNEEIYFK